MRHLTSSAKCWQTDSRGSPEPPFFTHQKETETMKINYLAPVQIVDSIQLARQICQHHQDAGFGATWTEVTYSNGAIRYHVDVFEIV